MFSVWVGPQHLINITGHVLPGQAVKEATPALKALQLYLHMHLSELAEQV